MLKRPPIVLQAAIFGLILVVLSVMGFQGVDRGVTQTLASIDDERITVSDFRHRYTGFLLGVGTKDNWITRERILDNMVNERLIVRRAYDEGIAGEEEFQKQVRLITTQALLDAYRKRAVIDKISVTEDELRRSFAWMNTRVRARHLYAATESEANGLYRLYLSGAPFDSLARMTFADPALAASGGDLGYFTWGEMDPAFEEVAFTLPVGEVSSPVKTDHGYSIIKVTDRIAVPLRTEYEYLTKKTYLRRILRGNKIIDQGQQFVRDLAASLEIQFSNETLEMLFEMWDPADMVTALSVFPSLELLSYNGSTWTLTDLGHRIEFTSERQRRRVQSLEDLQDFLRGLVTRDVLIVRAYDEGIDKDPDVQSKIRARIEQYIIERWKKSITKSLELIVEGGNQGTEIFKLASAEDVPISIVRDRYDRLGASYVHPAKLNVREILVSNRSRAEWTLLQLRRGESFTGLAKEHSLRTWSAERGGEVGYRAVGEYGTIGAELAAAEVGEHVGPLPIGPYYGVFQVIGKREPRRKAFEEAKEQIKQELVMEAKFKAYESMIDRLRSERALVINDDLLRSLSIP